MIQKVLLFVAVCAILLGGLYFINNRPGQSMDPITDAPQTSEPVQSNSGSYPPLPPEKLQAVFGATDHVDYIFYESNFSINTKGENAKQSISYFANSPAPKNGCKPFARVIYLADASVLLEGEIFYSPGCSHAVFFENKKPTYGNILSPAGISFFKQMSEQVSTKPQ